MFPRIFVFGLSAAVMTCGAGLGGAAWAEEVQVKLVNQGSDGTIMAFDPPFVKIKPGDSVKFVAKDQGHNAESIEGMAPEGAAPFKGEISKDFTQKFDKEGVYGVRCAPHFMMGMSGLIAVGDKYPNLDAAKSAKINPEAKKRFAASFAKLK